MLVESSLQTKEVCKKQTSEGEGLMADKRKNMDQNRRDAMYWAQEWQFKQKRRKILIGVGAVVAVVVIGFLINYISILGSRKTFSSEEEMRAAMQGRFVYDMYEDFYFEGDTVTKTYYSISHYDREFAEEYGYDEHGDSVYEDTVVEWDYRRGVIKCKWMEDIIVNKDGTISYYHVNFTKTDEPAPEPIDPSTLSNYDPEGAEDGGTDGSEAVPGTEEGTDPLTDETLPEEEKEALEAEQESLEETQDAAEKAGILPEGETDAT